MSTIYEAMSPGGHEAYATSIFSKIKAYLDSNPYGYVSKSDIPTVLGTKSYGRSEDNRNKKIKIKINPKRYWMLCFTVTLYQSYKATKVMISGYNYSTTHWYSPKANIIGSSETTAFNVYFGYDANMELWVGFDGDLYTGVTVDSVTNGYQQIYDYKDMFTISIVDELTTLQTTQTVYRPWYRDETVANATNASILNGFRSGGAGNITWGNQTGTGIWFNNDANGGSVGFRTNNPASGQVSMIIDGTVYIKEGQVNVGGAVNSFSVNGQTVTFSTLWGNTGTFTTQDTKNTAGSTDTSSKIFLIGATSQAANPQTYSHDTAYVGTDGCLYSGGTKVLTAHQDISGKADKSATVSTVAWSNNKLTKTINGTTSDVVSASDILDNLTSSQVTTALGYVPGPSYEFESSDDSINISASMVPGSETIDLKLNSVSWNNISGKPSTFAPSAHDHNYLVSAGTNTQSTSSTAYALGTFNVRWFNATGKLPGQPAQYGFLLTTATGTSSVENHQIFVEQPNGNLYHRGTNASTSSSPPAFKTILDSSNYTSFTRNSSGVIKVNSVTKTPTNAGTSLASPTPIIDSGYKFLCWLYVQSNGYIVGANYPGGAANPSATWRFANGYLANYGLTFYYLEIKDTI